jgi:hypothetical protein
MATEILIDPATNEPVQQDVPATPDVTPEAPAEAAPDETTARFEARIRELTDEIQGLRTLTQAQGSRQAAPMSTFQPKPEYEAHDYTRYLDSRYGQAFQQQQAALLQQMNQNDLLQARLDVDDTFGAGTWRKYGKQVEDAFQAELAKGTPEPRGKIFYRLATEKNWKLKPVEEREEQETRRTRRQGASLAVVSNQPPARRADAPGPAKPISAMTKDERDAAFQKYIQVNGGF